MTVKPQYYYKQSAVIPFVVEESCVKVFLITSRKNKHWIIPKGIVEKNLSPGASAAKEAFEEAGIKGQLMPEPIGSYTYEKWNGICNVEVFAMEVDEIFSDWEEKAFRSRTVVDIEKAVEMVFPEELRAIMMNFNSTKESKP
ncbi:MAG: hypothetical protein A2020_05710 [Lentisphaerae bacterium GWF2_45_14]|nr:MAG: hypothetical protein A2020_05710 [Lentisphaerae bacterium GWF2_45_14]